MRKLIIFCVLALFTVMIACKKEYIRVEPETPHNPFDDIDYSDGVINDLEGVDSSSFLGVHAFILSPSCAVPACHDGAFEPDYRTIESSYNTLVYASPIKADVSGKTFVHRVVPGDLDNSLLNERITTDDLVLGKMPLYDTLKPGEIKAIQDWILGGAKDIFGNSATEANLQPTFFGILAFDTDTLGVRYDTTRRDFVSPIELPSGKDVEFWMGLYDPQHSDGAFGLGYLLSYNRVQISEHPYDFSSATEIFMDEEAPLTPYYGPSYSDPRPVYPYYHSFSIDTDDYIPGKIYFMRVYVQDVSHSKVTELPQNDSPIYLMTFFSFMVL